MSLLAHRCLGRVYDSPSPSIDELEASGELREAVIIICHWDCDNIDELSKYLDDA
jgi:hypothetical protein